MKIIEKNQIDNEPFCENESLEASQASAQSVVPKQLTNDKIFRSISSSLKNVICKLFNQ